MKYTVIGQDGNKYGPADAEQVCQWIAQKRVDSRTLIYVEGASDWTYAGLLPEFAVAFAPVTTGMPPVSAAVPPTNQLAAWGLACGIISWLCCCCGAPFSLIGLVLSMVALGQINARPGTQEGRSMAIAGIVLSAASLLWSIGLTVLNIVNGIMNNGANTGNVTWNFGSN